MCGITGIVGPQLGGARDERVRAMTRAIAHRGPDGEGFFGDAHCALGHRRLSIIDLSSNGAQPMTNEDGSIQVVFNGEIYGFGALRDELEKKGHTFRSRSDTEVIVHLYEEEGPAGFARLNGMFAIAVWDTRTRTLWLARDRFGQKPIFYAEVGGAFAFASEVRALRQLPGLSREPSPAAIDAFLTTHFVPSPLSFLRDVRRLPAAGLLELRVGEAPRVTRFWQQTITRRASVRFDEAVDEAAWLVRTSVERQLVADVPVGLFLSGGVDSTLVLASLARLGRANVPVFSASFEGSGPQNEVPFARAAAERFGAHVTEVSIPSRAFLDVERIVAMYDEPFADIAALPTHLLSKAAREHVTVALTGDGGDELFGGYQHHLVGLWLDRLGAASPARRALAGAVAAALREKVASRSKLRFIRRAAETLARRDFREGVVALRANLQRAERPALYTSEFAAAVADLDPYASLVPPPGMGAEGLFDVSRDLVLADLLLHKTDVTAMAASLECRSPFLDVPLADFAASLPLDALARVQGKRVLRAALEREIGPALARRRKVGFAPPLDAWMRGELAPMLRDALTPAGARVHAYVRRDAAVKLVEDHIASRADNKRVLWAMLLLEVWLRSLSAGEADRRGAPVLSRAPVE